MFPFDDVTCQLSPHFKIVFLLKLKLRLNENNVSIDVLYSKLLVDHGHLKELHLIMFDFGKRFIYEQPRFHCATPSLNDV